MINSDHVAALVAIAALPLDIDKSIGRLVEEAMNLTGSRIALLAVLDEEQGVVEVRYGAGVGLDENRLGEKMNVKEGEGEGIVAAVAARGEPVIIADVSKDPRYRQFFSSSASELAVPVFDRFGRVRAVLNLESDQTNRYHHSDQKIGEAIANLISIVLEREEQNRREDALIQIGESLDSVQTEEELIERVLTVAAEVLRLHSSSIFLYDKGMDKFMLRGTRGSLKDLVGKIGYTVEDGCTGWVCGHGEPLLSNAPQSDPRWRGQYLEFPGEEIASFLAVPIVLRGKTVGAIRVVRRFGSTKYINNSFTSEDQRLLMTVADQVAVAIDNLRMMQAALSTERMAAWGELSAKSSHMIGNRVFAVKGDVNELAYLLEQKDLNRDKLQEIQKSLKMNLSRVDEILQEFRDYLTASQVNLSKTDLNSLVKDAVDEIFPRRSPIELMYSFSADLPQVEVDVTRLRRAISEIVENALSFYNEGQFKVTTKIADAELVRIASLPSSQKYAEILFEDQGPGVSAEVKGQLFRPFFSTRVKGMGLGLSIVHGILAAHGGTVIEIGEQGHGAKFAFLLPLSERPSK